MTAENYEITCQLWQARKLRNRHRGQVSRIRV
jgi:hypothetical protein